MRGALSIVRLEIAAVSSEYTKKKKKKRRVARCMGIGALGAGTSAYSAILQSQQKQQQQGEKGKSSRVGKVLCNTYTVIHSLLYRTTGVPEPLGGKELTQQNKLHSDDYK